MTRFMALMMLAVALAACDPTSTDPDPTVTVPLETSTTTAAAATTSTAAVDEVPDCLAGTLPFAEQGIVAALDSPQHDATTIGGIRWQPDEACERVLIEFLADGGSPATRLGPVGVTVAPDTGIVRISLPEAVEASAIGDSLISGPLVDHIYVVEGITDGLVVDVHLAARAAARAFTTTSPSRLIIDLRPTSDVPIGSSPDNGGSVVVSSPLPGPNLYPLQVAGYAAPGVDAVRITLSADDQTALERSMSTVTDRHLWRAFAVTISDGPSGLVQVRVTDAAATDDDGVVVELDLP
jgi:hypothetical protein